MNSLHTDVAAYSLGLLEQQDRLDFEAHLTQCESCPAELAELAAMADLFVGVDPVQAGHEEPAGAAELGDLVRRRADARRRRARLQVVLAAAACLVLLAGGVALGFAAAPGQPLPVVAIVGQRHSATNARTGLTGTVGLVAKTWGTQVTLDLAGVRGPLECQLVAVSSTGKRRVITGWFVPPSGYGVAGHPGHLLIIGGTALPVNELSRVEVQVVNGATLLSIPL